VNRRRPSVLLTVSVSVAAAALTGCGPKAHTAATPTVPKAATTAAGGAGAAGGSGKTCTGGHTRATINGAVKCLAPGQECSAKATTQYPRYGYICATVNGRLVLHRA